MKMSIFKIVFILGFLSFALSSCDPERNKASLHDSADTLHTENAKHKYEDGTLQPVKDTSGVKKDSVMNSGNVDPSGRAGKQ